MTPIEKMSELDLHTFQSYIRVFGGMIADSSFFIDTAPINHILRVWNNAKSKYLFKLMGEELILKRQFSYTKSECDISKEISDFLHDERNRFCAEWYSKVSSKFRNTDWNLFLFLDFLVNNKEWLMNNRVPPHVNFEVPLPNGKIYKVQSGTKIMHALGKISQAFGVTSFEDFRLQHSLILNNRTITGTVCLSIHPMDYATMSDNDCDWDSCMSWQNLGSYRLGTTEMLNSNCVIVAYVESSRPMQWENTFGSFSWNNKKWRTLVVANQTTIANVKNYPYQHDELTKFVLDWVKELAETNMAWHYQDDLFTKDKNGVFENTSHSIARLVFDTDLMYNDTECNDKQTCYITTNDLIARREWDIYHSISYYNDCFHVHYSGPAECMCCGAIDETMETSWLFCNKCEDLIWCPDCELWYPRNEAVLIDGEYYCRSCASTHWCTCEYCNNYVDDEDICSYDIICNDQYIDSMSFCPNCIDEAFKKIFKPHTKQNEYEIDWNSLTYLGKKHLYNCRNVLYNSDDLESWIESLNRMAERGDDDNE